MAVPQLSGVRSVGNRWAQRRDLAERQRITTYRHSGNTGMWLIILLGTITGLALGLTGSGGSIFAVPMLVYGVDTPLAQAVAMSLLAVAATAAVGAARGLFVCAVVVRSGLLFAASGFLIVPALQLTTGLSMRRTVATSLLIIAIVSTSGITAYFARGGRVPADTTAWFIVGGLAGLGLGALLAGRLTGATLQRTFAVFVLLVGIAVLLRESLAFV